MTKLIQKINNVIESTIDNHFQCYKIKSRGSKELHLTKIFKTFTTVKIEKRVLGSAK